MNIETVKPIPAELPVAKISLHLTFPERAPIFVFKETNVKRKIPNGFPATKPKNMAQATGELMALLMLWEVMTIPELTKAKRGTIKNAVQGWIWCSNHSTTETDPLAIFLVLMTFSTVERSINSSVSIYSFETKGLLGARSPSITPAIVG